MPTFYDRFLECEQQWPQNVALEMQYRDRLESYTYADLRRMSESIGRWLVEHGHAAGSRFAILADNHPRWIAAYLGTIAAGCTAVPLDAAYDASQVAKLLQDSGSALLFCDSRHLGVAQAAVSGSSTKLILLDSKPHGGSQQNIPEITADLDAIFAGGPGKFTPVPAASDDIAAILYTSGTTADPKGVMLTHANLLAECTAVFGFLRLGPSDAVLGVLPLFHALAQMANLLLPLVVGARVVYLDTLNTTELLRALHERNVTAFACVPQFFYLIHERIFREVAKRGLSARLAFRAMMKLTRLSRAIGWNAGKLFFRSIHQIFGPRMRFLVTGGSRWDPMIGRDFYSLGIDILQAYGLTETTGGALCTPVEGNVIGSVGKPLPTVEVKIVSPELRESGPPTGEIAIRAPIVMKGYWKRPDATAVVVRDGWLHTGDVGYFDSAGNLVITGRQKEVIVLSSGKNIYPEEIEAHYQQASSIREICVLGMVSRPGEPFSERLHAVIVPDFNVLRQRKVVNMKELIRWELEGLSQKLPPTKRVLSYEVWQDELPRTTTRKLKRFEIEKRVRGGLHAGTAEGPPERPLDAEEAAWLEQDDVRRALRIVREESKVSKTIHPRDNLELDLGLDSVQRVELLVGLEKELGGDVDESRMPEIYTVRELIDTVRTSALGVAAGKSPRAFVGWDAIFSEEVTNPEVLELGKNRPIAAATMFLAFRLLFLFLRDRFDLKVTGLEKLPPKGPFIISPNHQSYLDPFVLGSVLPWQIFRDLFEVGTSEIFGFAIMRPIARWLRVLVVDPDANLIPAMRGGAFGLRLGRVLMLFPEGERSIDGEPKVFKKGAAILSAHLQVPIVPVAMDGLYEVWPRGKGFFQKFNPLRMSFGDPIYPPSKAQFTEADYSQLTAELKARVVEMWMELHGQKSESAQAAATH